MRAAVGLGLACSGAGKDLSTLAIVGAKKFCTVLFGSNNSSNNINFLGKKQGRRKSKRQEAVARAIRDRLPAASSCWGNVSVVQGVRGRRGGSQRERPGDGAGEDDPAGATATAPAAAWCCVCPGGDCALQPNPSANGKEDAGLRSLIERNDFYSSDCNPHADAFPVGAHLIE